MDLLIAKVFLKEIFAADCGILHYYRVVLDHVGAFTRCTCDFYLYFTKGGIICIGIFVIDAIPHLYIALQRLSFSFYFHLQHALLASSGGPLLLLID